MNKKNKSNNNKYKKMNNNKNKIQMRMILEIIWMKKSIGNIEEIKFKKCRTNQLNWNILNKNIVLFMLKGLITIFLLKLKKI